MSGQTPEAFQKVYQHTGNPRADDLSCVGFTQLCPYSLDLLCVSTAIFVPIARMRKRKGEGRSPGTAPVPSHYCCAGREGGREEGAAAAATAAFDGLDCARRQLSQPTHSQDITPSRSFKRS